MVILTGMVKRKDLVKRVVNHLTHFLSFLRQFFLSVSDLHFTFKVWFCWVFFWGGVSLVIFH